MEAATLQTTDADISNGNYSAPQPPIHQKEPIEKAIYDHYQDLKTRVVEQKEVKAREHVLQLRYKRVAVGLMTLAAALIAAAAMFSNSTLWILAALLPVLAIGLFAFSFDHRAEERRIGDELKRLEFERDLMKLQPDRGECRSEKMLGNNDSQLRGYYELNLEQCAKIFWVGILCLCAGVGVIAATLHSVMMSKDHQQTQIVIGVVGAVGSILINYVAAIFLKMHSEILTILKEFQSKLVDTQELYLANVLASRIDQSTTRENALKDLSLAIAKYRRSENGGDAGE
jgi:hypothetical protein